MRRREKIFHSFTWKFPLIPNRSQNTATMSTRAKGETKKITFNGRLYRPNVPPSEQPDVLTITKRFKNLKPAEAAAVRITQEELRNFAIVWRRLYQVPTVTRARLEAWRQGNQDEIRNWDLGGFFNTEKEDEEQGIKIEKPGCPSEIRDAPNDPNNAPGAQAPARRPQPFAEGQQLGQASTEELGAALASISRTVSLLRRLSNEADNDDPYKKALSDLAGQLSAGLDRAWQAKQALSQQLINLSALAPTVPNPIEGGKKRGHHAVEEDGEEEGGEEKRKRLKARRAQVVANLNADDGLAFDSSAIDPRLYGQSMPDTGNPTDTGRGTAGLESLQQGGVFGTQRSREIAENNFQYPAGSQSGAGGHSSGPVA